MMLFRMAGRFFSNTVLVGGNVLAGAAAVATLLMVVIGTADVIAMAIFNTAVPAAYEGTEALIVCLGFGGIAYAQASKSHFKVEMFVRHLSVKIRKILDLFGSIIGFIFFSIFTWQSALYFWQSWLIKESEQGLVEFPIYPAKFMMFIAIGFMTLQLLVDIFRSLDDLCRMNQQLNEQSK